MRRGEPAAEAARTCSTSSPARSRVSETVEVGKGRFSGVDVHGPVLDAAGRRGDRLPRIEQAGGIAGGLEGEEGVDLGRGEPAAHLVDLLSCDTQLTGGPAAHCLPTLQ